MASNPPVSAQKSSLTQTEPKQLSINRTLEEIRSQLSRTTTLDYPDVVLRQTAKDLEGREGEKFPSSSPESNLFKSMTLFEFDNGTLLTTVVQEQYKTFGIDLMLKLQQEYNCQTPSEKATAELATINYIRTLEIQNRITRYLGIGTINEVGLKFLDIMSKELARANSHYLTAIQALKAMKQPQLELNIKANTAVIGQNQIVQTTAIEEDKPNIY